MRVGGRERENVSEKTFRLKEVDGRTTERNRREEKKHSIETINHLRTSS